MNDERKPGEWGRIAANVLVVGFGGARRSLRQIVEIFAEENPHWPFAHLTACPPIPALTWRRVVLPGVGSWRIQLAMSG